MIFIKIIKDTDKTYPQRLLQIKNHPKKIFVEGNDEILNHESIAIVGSRKCTMYGWKQAMSFGKELSQNGICVISGMAIGIDKAAHIGAKSGWGKTIAVLGGGFDDIYPEENKELFYEIIQNGGCVISEYEPCQKTVPSNFPKRNRIISGIARGTLIIEAAQRSGSLITARYTKEQGKPLFCIPSNLGGSKGIGANQLIKNGAILTMSADDIFKELGIEKLTRTNKEKRRKGIEVDKSYREVYNALENMPISVDEINRRTKLSIAKINHDLTMLQLKGFIKSHPGNQYSLIEE